MSLNSCLNDLNFIFQEVLISKLSHKKVRIGKEKNETKNLSSREQVS